MWTNHAVWTGGLGSTDNTNWAPDWTVVASQSGISLLQSPSPEGMSFIVVINQGQPNEKRLFPTDKNPSASEMNRGLDPNEAFEQFQKLLIEHGGIVSGSAGADPSKSNTFEELDSRLMAMSELPQDIAFELQRSGTTDVGMPKQRLDLNLNKIGKLAIFNMSEDLYLAKMRYASYDMQTRITALQSCKVDILQHYMNPDVLSAMLSANRQLKSLYRQKRRAALAEGKSLQEFVAEAKAGEMEIEEPMLPTEPIVAMRVKFEDQHGNEITGLPYRIGVRGAVNLREARERTKFGTNPGEFGAGEKLFEKGGLINNPTPRDESWNGQGLDPTKEWHYLYAYRIAGEPKEMIMPNGETVKEFPWPKGNIKISVSTPDNVSNTLDWGNSRLKTYRAVSSMTQNRDAEIAPAEALQQLFSHSLKLTREKEYVRLNITIPVYKQPLPMHLVEMPPNSGKVVSRWSLEPNLDAIPEHQKVRLTMKVMRPESNDGWAEADKIEPTSRAGHDDKFLQFEEFTSPAGRAAMRAGTIGANAVKGMKFLIKPLNNSWASAQNYTFIDTDINGLMRASLPVGRYEVVRVSDINPDGTSAYVESDEPYATPFEQLPATTRQGIVIARNGADQFGKKFAMKEFPVARLQVPAAYYYRDYDEDDSTPMGVVGAKMIVRTDYSNDYTARLTNFKLETPFPPLKRGENANPDTIYGKLSLIHPEIDSGGWPLAGVATDTTDAMFDTATIVMMEDSSIDISRIPEYERRLEAQRDPTGVLAPSPMMPTVGNPVEYKGFIISRDYFDTGIGPIPKGGLPDFGPNMVKAADTIYEFDMGKLENPFYDQGVIEVMSYYPKNGTLRRKISMPNNTKPSNVLEYSALDRTKVFQAKYDLDQLSTQTAALRKFFNNIPTIYYLKMQASPEAAVMTGRWVVLTDFGQLDNPTLMSPEDAFENIVNRIDKFFGAPMTHFMMSSPPPRGMFRSDMSWNLAKGSASQTGPNAPVLWRWPGFDWRAYWPQTESWLFADEGDTDDDDTDNGNIGSGYTGGGTTGGGATVFAPGLFLGSKNVNASYDNLDDSVMVAPPPSNNNDDEDDTLGMISW